MLSQWCCHKETFKYCQPVMFLVSFINNVGSCIFAVIYSVHLLHRSQNYTPSVCLVSRNSLYIFSFVASGIFFFYFRCLVPNLTSINLQICASDYTKIFLEVSSIICSPCVVCSRDNPQE